MGYRRIAQAAWSGVAVAGGNLGSAAYASCDRRLGGIIPAEEMMDMPPRADDVVWMGTGVSIHDTGRDTAAQIEEAEHIALQLLGYARAIADADGHVTACGQPGCPLEHHPAGATAVRLAVALAASAAVHGLDVVVVPDDRQRHLAHRRFVDQLSEAAASVWCCRRSVHRQGRCLFDSSGPDSGVCGRVLAVSRHYELGALAG